MEIENKIINRLMIFNEWLKEIIEKYWNAVLLKKSIICMILAFLTNVTYGQQVDNDLKNTLVTYMYDRGEFNDSDIAILMNNSQSILFWLDEVSVECNQSLKCFVFGSSAEHSKKFLVLVKNNDERLILGNDLQKELAENQFYDFVKFHNTKEIICLYNTVLAKELFEIYQHNNEVTQLNLIEFPEVFK